MNGQRSADVLVLGAGPAGCCAALRLLQLGYRVALAERALRPPPNVGESLTPGVANIHALLELGEGIALLPSPGAARRVTVWASREPQTQEQANVMVDRAAHDQVLIDAVRARGGEVIAPATFSGAGGSAGDWHARLDTPSGMRDIDARLIIDARGRHHPGSRAMRSGAPSLLAVWADLEEGPSESMVEAQADGWLWGATRADGRYRVMAFCDPQAVRGQVLADWLAARMQASALFQLERPSIAVACAASAQFDDLAWQPGYLKTGDAAFTLDPLSSSGVEKAMRFALQTVVAAHTMLSDHGRAASQLAREFYEERLSEAVARHHGWSQRFYQTAWPGDEHPFWRTRRSAQPMRSASPGSLAERVQAAIAADAAPAPEPRLSAPSPQLLQGDVKLSEALRFVEMACVVADKVQLKRAIAHPNLARPVAFVAGAELVPLLDVLAVVPRLPTAVQLWSNCIPQPDAMRIALWLCMHGLLRAA